MSKLEANLVLLSITFFWSIQYAFFQNVPQDISDFVFVTLTNSIGVVLIGTIFWKALSKLTGKIVKQGLLLAVLLFSSKTFFIMSSCSLEADTTFFLSETYIVFIPLVMRYFGKKVKRNNWTSVAIVLTGLLLATGVHLQGIGRQVVLVALSNVLFASYMVVLEQIIDKANPILIALCQMFFMVPLGLIGWIVTQPETLFALPMDIQFWSRVLVIAVFVYGFTTIMQIYAQRYISALSASLIFSLETVFTLLISLLCPTPLGTPPETVTVYKAIGCLLILLGVLLSDGTIQQHNSGEKRREPWDEIGNDPCP